MALAVVIAGDEHRVQVTFKDDGVPTSPTSATYAVQDVETGDVLRAATAITPITSGVATVVLSYDDNSMHNSGADSEQHELIVVANFGTDAAGKPRQLTRSYKYQVQRSP